MCRFSVNISQSPIAFIRRKCYCQVSSGGGTACPFPRAPFLHLCACSSLRAPHRSQRPRSPVHLERLAICAGPKRNGWLDERQEQLLRQCGNGEILRHTQRRKNQMLVPEKSARGQPSQAGLQWNTTQNVLIQRWATSAHVLLRRSWLEGIW